MSGFTFKEFSQTLAGLYRRYPDLWIMTGVIAGPVSLAVYNSVRTSTSHPDVCWTSQGRRQGVVQAERDYESYSYHNHWFRRFIYGYHEKPLTNGSFMTTPEFADHVVQMPNSGIPHPATKFTSKQ
eukprot:GILI01033061.1.p1 GENE.GILI01033061.1~~GILI01033061.1.p1  ORF type:complete len:145 (+),score=42.05 GILI01033061.1:58-435(+)